LLPQEDPLPRVDLHLIKMLYSGCVLTLNSRQSRVFVWGEVLPRQRVELWGSEGISVGGFGPRGDVMVVMYLFRCRTRGRMVRDFERVDKL
jgi:hypothetical protein